MCSSDLMLTANECRLAESFARGAAFTCLIGADWNSTRRTLQKTTSALKLGLGRLFLVLELHLFAFALWRLFTAIRVGSNSAPVLSTLLVMHAATLFLSSPFLWRSSNLLPLFNQLLSAAKEKTTTRGAETRPRMSAPHFQYMLAGYLFICVVASVSTAYIEGHFTLEATGSVRIAGAAALATVLRIGAIFAVFGLVQMYVFLYYRLVKTTLALARARCEGATAATTMPRTRILSYNSLRILNNNFNYGPFGLVILPGMKCIALAVALLFVFNGIQLRAAAAVVSTSRAQVGSYEIGRAHV